MKRVSVNLSWLSDPLNHDLRDGVFFARICKSSPVTLNILWKFYQIAEENGAVIEELPNPTDQELEFVQKIIGQSFIFTEDYLFSKICQLLPDLCLGNNMDFSKILFTRLTELKESGKSTGAIKNVYFKIMCWMYKFKKIALLLGKQPLPKILFRSESITNHELLFLRIISELGADILLLEINGDGDYLSRDPESKYSELIIAAGENFKPDFSLKKFVKERPKTVEDFLSESAYVRTVASSAERELNDVLYSDSGLYRNRQFAKAETVTLHTTYDEVFILWNQELKYRPSFETSDTCVKVPAIYIKVSGVENGDVTEYWNKLRSLQKNAVLLKGMSFHLNTPNQFSNIALKYIRNCKLDREGLKKDKMYPFKILREEVQEHILDKIQLMIDKRIIKGTGTTGKEYIILSSILNLNKAYYRLLQNFDFTKVNPKIILLSTNENETGKIEDAILATFFNLVGFDVALFVPTGYQTIERFMDSNLPVEHQAGEYLYDLAIPDFSNMQTNKPKNTFKSLIESVKKVIS